ncbi:hypothetical protein, partial [Xanthomonas campestris]|uniref:hypothetical protein n=3 Tax=Xanthomonas campestris TaxID=339 RepID=UPI001C84E593
RTHLTAARYVLLAALRLERFLQAGRHSLRCRSVFVARRSACALVGRSIIAAVAFHLIVEWQALSGMARFLKRRPIRQLALLARGVMGGGDSVRFFLKNTLLPS